MGEISSYIVGREIPFTVWLEQLQHYLELNKIDSDNDRIHITMFLLEKDIMLYMKDWYKPHGLSWRLFLLILQNQTLLKYLRMNYEEQERKEQSSKRKAEEIAAKELSNKKRKE